MTANHGDGRDDGPVPRSSAPGWPPASGWDSPVSAGPSDTVASVDEGPSVASRIVSTVLALVVGVVYGAVGTVAHPLVLAVGPVTIPWGLIVSLVGVLALFVGFRLVLGERLAVVAAGVGVVGIVTLFSLESAGGSVLIPNEVQGWIWVVAPAVLAAVVIIWPSTRNRRGGADRPPVRRG